MARWLVKRSGRWAVVVAGDAVRAQCYHPAQGIRHGVPVLVGQSVDQVETHGAESVGADALDQRRHLVVWLDAVDRLLHQRVEVLDAQADTVKPTPFSRATVDCSMVRGSISIEYSR